MEIDLKGCIFTWDNKREGMANVREKLDRALANWKWRVLFPNATCEDLPVFGSDYSPLLLKLTPLRVDI